MPIHIKLNDADWSMLCSRLKIVNQDEFRKWINNPVQKYSLEDLKKMKLIQEIKMLKHRNTMMQQEERKIETTNLSPLTPYQWDKVYDILLQRVDAGYQCLKCNKTYSLFEDGRKHILEYEKIAVQEAIKEVLH